MHLIFDCVRRYREYQDRFSDGIRSPNTGSNAVGTEGASLGGVGHSGGGDNSHLVLNLQQLRELQEQQLRRLLNSNISSNGSNESS